jgi:hypothetical protein
VDRSAERYRLHDRWDLAVPAASERDDPVVPVREHRATVRVRSCARGSRASSTRKPYEGRESRNITVCSYLAARTLSLDGVQACFSLYTAGGVLVLAGLQKTGLKVKFDEQARGKSPPPAR